MYINKLKLCKNRKKFNIPWYKAQKSILKLSSVNGLKPLYVIKQYIFLLDVITHVYIYFSRATQYLM